MSFLLRDPTSVAVAVRCWAALAAVRATLTAARRNLPPAPPPDQVHLRMVQPGDTGAAATISALRPASISWSNIPDYYSPAAFHDLARACSTPTMTMQLAASSIGSPSASFSEAAAVVTPTPTVHYVSSMNWPMDTKGACHLDEVLPCQKRGAGEGGRTAPTQALTNVRT